MGQGTEERLTEDIAHTREDLSRNVDELVDRVAPSRIVERRRQAVRDRFRSVKDSVIGTAHDGTRAVSGAHGAAHAVRSQAEGSPLTAGLVAFGVGALVAGLLPSSSAETEVAQRVVDVAKEHGEPVMDEVKAAGGEVGQHLKERASDAVDEVRATAQESAQHLKDQGQASVGNVRDTAAPSG